MNAVFPLQSQWAGVTPSAAANTPAIAAKSDAPSTSSAPVGPLGAATPASVKCNWTEHISPDGYKYYHNSATGESTVRSANLFCCFCFFGLCSFLFLSHLFNLCGMGILDLQWIKPEELTLYEQQQQKVSVQQPPNQPSLQAFPTQRVTQSTQSQAPALQSHFRQAEQFQHPAVSSMVS